MTIESTAGRNLHLFRRLTWVWTIGWLSGKGKADREQTKRWSNTWHLLGPGVGLLSPSYRWRDWGPDRLNNFLRVITFVNGRAITHAQTCLTPEDVLTGPGQLPLFSLSKIYWVSTLYNVLLIRHQFFIKMDRNLKREGIWKIFLSSWVIF